MRFIPWLYDLVMAAADRTRLGRWRRDVVAPARGRILEIGAGTGLNFRHYDAGALVVATDVDPEMLARSTTRARASRARILFVVADAEALPFRSGAFDGATVGLALCTIADPNTALGELRRVMRSCALLHLFEHVRVPHPVVGRLQDWLTPIWRHLAGGCRLNRRTEATVASNGFEIEDVRPHALGVFLAITARSTSDQSIN